MTILFLSLSLSLMHIPLMCGISNAYLNVLIYATNAQLMVMRCNPVTQLLRWLHLICHGVMDVVIMAWPLPQPEHEWAYSSTARLQRKGIILPGNGFIYFGEKQA